MGLSRLIGVESAGVCTTDKNPSLRTLAQKHKVIWINGDDIQRLKSSQPLAAIQRISEEDLADAIANVDNARGGKQVLGAYQVYKSSVADRFGVASANLCLDHTGRFATEGVKSYPKSASAETFGRLTYLAAALSAASFDFASADLALRPVKERAAAMQNAIKYGADKKSFEERLNWTEAAIRDFAPDGHTIAKQVRKKLTESANNVPAEDLAEIVVQMSHDNRLFNAARQLEHAAFAIEPPTLDQLAVEAQSYMGALLDFSGIERRRFRDSWQSTTPKSAIENEQAPEAVSDEGEQGKLI